MNELALSLACATLLVASSATGALAASHVAVNSGDSMRPTLCANSALVVERDATPRVGDVVALDTGDGRVYHRLVGIDGRDLLVRGDNVHGASPDLVNVTGTDRPADLVGGNGGRYAYPHRRDVAGVVTGVLYDGCGPV